jgi:hypothetical protein
VNLIIGALLVAVASLAPASVLASRRAAVLALLPLLDLVLLGRYVFGSSAGTSRWETYGHVWGATVPLTALSAVALIACVLAIGFAATRQRPQAVRRATLATGLTCVLLVTVTVIAFGVGS